MSITTEVGRISVIVPAGFNVVFLYLCLWRGDHSIRGCDLRSDFQQQATLRLQTQAAEFKALGYAAWRQVTADDAGVLNAVGPLAGM